jgi:release factor glutamine methyltransferase
MSEPRSMTALLSDERITVAEALADAMDRLAAADIDESRREARLLLAAALGVDAATILGHPDRLLKRGEQERFVALTARRAAHEPVARVIGRREFWSLDFAVAPETLVPRPDSETVVEAALAQIGDRAAPLRLLDMGTGTGCLLLALLSELPRATGIGLDIAPNAAITARRNAISLGLAARTSFVVGAWAAAIDGRFDVILANPPYIESKAIAGLAQEVARYDPHRALDGGEDGLDAYRALAPEMARLMCRNGFGVFELGAGQAQSVAALMRHSGLAISGIRRDLAGVERCLIIGRS